MDKHKEGSLVVLMLGLFWLASFMALVLYAMVSHLSTLVALREVELQHWYLMQGGMQSALAHLNDTPELYLQEQGTVTLYEGLWQVDMRESGLMLTLQYRGFGEGKGIIEGELHDKETSLIHLIWHIACTRQGQPWRFVTGERIYE
jgi:hypothetical protein